MDYEPKPDEAADYERQVCRNVLKLREEVQFYQDYYVPTFGALARYTAAEYGLPEYDAARYIRQLEEEDILPHEIIYGQKNGAARNIISWSMYTHFIPLYRELHDASEFRAWLPEAMKIVLPTNSIHTRETCIEQCQNGDGFCCDKSNACVVRMLSDSVKVSQPFYGLQKPEMDSFEQEMSGLRRLLADTMTLIDVLEEREVLTHQEAEAVTRQQTIWITDLARQDG